MKDTGERLIPEGNHKTLTYGEHLARYQSVLSSVKGKTVVDIASGAGYGTNLIAKHAKLVTGIDYSIEAIEYSKKLYKAKNLKFVQGDAQNIPIKDSSIDVVVSLETIEHIHDPEKFVKEVKRILKPSGQFIVSTPNDDEYIEDNEFHLHEFQLKELKKLINKYFKNSTYYYQGSYFSAGVYDENLFTKEGSYSGKTTKTFGQPINKAIYFIASASDDDVALLDNNTVIADSWNTKDDIQRDKERQIDRGKLDLALRDAQKKVTELVLAKEAIEVERNQAYEKLDRIKKLPMMKSVIYLYKKLKPKKLN